MQLTRFRALSLFENHRIGPSVARDSSVTSVTSLLLALPLMWRNHRRLLDTAGIQVLEVSFEVLSEMVGRLA